MVRRVEGSAALQLQAASIGKPSGGWVRDPPTAWTVLQHDGPDHLGLRCNAFPDHQMALIASGCAPFRPARTPTRCWTAT